jgi:hypothetical protein
VFSTAFLTLTKSVSRTVSNEGMVSTLLMGELHGGETILRC